MNKPITLYLIGYPGVGKYSIAQELQRTAPHTFGPDNQNTGFKMVDNHLANNAIFSLLDRVPHESTDVPEIGWTAIRKIRDAIIEYVAHDREHSFVFTNVLGNIERDKAIFNQIKGCAATRSSLFIPVKLLVDHEEHQRRVSNPARALRHKSTSFTIANMPAGLLEIEDPNLFTLDTTHLTAEQAAAAIINFIKSRL